MWINLNCNQFLYIHYQYLPRLKYAENSIFHVKFKRLDEKFRNFGITKDQQNTIYMVLSAILNLGNIKFDESPADNTCRIQNDSKKFICSISALLKVNENELEDVLTCLTRQVGKQQIK